MPNFEESSASEIRLKRARTPSSYNLSFTAASLRPELARIVAECYLAVGDWDLAREKVLSSNALQCRSANSALRLEMELRQRLATLTHDQVVLLAQATAEDRIAVAWLAACKRIPFAFEFASEVLRDKLAAQDPAMRPSDYETYVENKTLAHPELARLSASTKVRIRQALTRMLSEAGLLAKEGGSLAILRPALSPGVVRVITSDNPNWLAGFLVPDNEIPNF
jgi:hypothetical protein